jgi:hypothetical protein
MAHSLPSGIRSEDCDPLVFDPVASSMYAPVPVRFLDKILIDRAIIECFEHFHDRRPIKITALTAGNDFVLLFEELGDAAGQIGVEPMGEGECL